MIVIVHPNGQREAYQNAQKAVQDKEGIVHFLDQNGIEVGSKFFEGHVLEGGAVELYEEPAAPDKEEESEHEEHAAS